MKKRSLISYIITVAMLCAMLAGGACGLVTGLLHTLLGIPAILAGILTQLMLWSVNLIVMSGRAVRPSLSTISLSFPASRWIAAGQTA